MEDHRYFLDSPIRLALFLYICIGVEKYESEKQRRQRAGGSDDRHVMRAGQCEVVARGWGVRGARPFSWLGKFNFVRTERLPRNVAHDRKGRPAQGSAVEHHGGQELS